MLMGFAAVLALHRLNEALHIDRKPARRIAMVHDLCLQDELIVLDQLVLLLEKRLALKVELEPLQHLARNPLRCPPLILEVPLIDLVELPCIKPEMVNALGLDGCALHPVLAVEELNHFSECVSDGAIVPDHQILHGLHEPPLDVPSGGRLDGSVDKTLATSHGVKEELLGREPPQIRILDKSSTFGAEVVLREVRQRALVEAKRNTLAFNILLPDTSNHLRDIDERSLGSSSHHTDDIVGVPERLLRHVTGVVTSFVQNLVDLVLERLHDGTAWLLLQIPTLHLLNQAFDIRLGAVHDLVDNGHRPRVGDEVSDTDGEPVLQKPVVHRELRLAQKRTSGIRPKLHPDDVHKAAGGGPERLFAQRPCQ